MHGRSSHLLQPCACPISSHLYHCSQKKEGFQRLGCDPSHVQFSWFCPLSCNGFNTTWIGSSTDTSNSRQPGCRSKHRHFSKEIIRLLLLSHAHNLIPTWCTLEFSSWPTMQAPDLEMQVLVYGCWLNSENHGMLLRLGCRCIKELWASRASNS